MRFASHFAQLVGNTPLVRLRGLSELTKCDIFGKCEFMNPGGSVKDRAARFIVEDALKSGALRPGATIVEGTAGNTGLGLAMMGASVGCKTIVVIPENIASEKIEMLRLLGAEVRTVPVRPYMDEGNYQHIAHRLADEMNANAPGSAFWASQFENLSNQRAHIETTAPEIWADMDGKLDGFVCAVGTGGTLSGIARGLQARSTDVRIGVVDPEGSAVYHWARGEPLTLAGSSVSEGIGNARVTGNLEGTKVDVAFRATDAEALPLIFDLVEREGLFVGGSSAINLSGAYQMAKWMGPGHRIVTMLCDSGARYQSKVFNPVFLREKGLPVPHWLDAAT